MNLPYLMFGYAATILLALVGWRVGIRGVPGLAGMQKLCWGLSVALIGMLLFASRAVLPLWVTSVVANETILIYSLFFFAALSQCLGYRSRIVWWGTGLLLLQLAANSYFTFIDPSLPLRFIVTTAVPALSSVAAAYLLFLHSSDPERMGSRSAARRPLMSAMAWLQVLMASSAAVRIVLTMFHPPAHVQELDLIQSAFTYLNLIFNLGAAAGLLWLGFLIHREDLYARANTDGLTGLMNRRAFEEVLFRELCRAHDGGRSLPVIMGDIDHFKRVNDNYGHAAGDQVLRKVGCALLHTLRPADVLARVGGEEFAILLRETDLARGLEVAERLRSEVAALSDLPEGIRVTISLGLAGSLPHEAPAALMQRCDEALYSSKRDGRNRVSMASSEPCGGGEGLAPSDRSPFAHPREKKECT